MRPRFALIAVLGILVAAPPARAAERSHAPAGSAAGATREAAAAARVRRFWTPERRHAARPLELVIDSRGAPRLHPGRPAPAATASFLQVPAPKVPPHSFNGRIFLKQGNLLAYCSGTAIDSPTRQLVLTAGHCVNSGHEGGHPAVWSQYLEFFPALTAGKAPFGAFVAKRGHAYAPRQWTKRGNPDFDLGAFLVHPNHRGENVADAVGGGAAIALGLRRAQRFLSFGYPGSARRMQGCRSPYAGDDSLTFPFPGPPTMGIRCHWAPGASGGGWLIDGGAEIDGLNSYLHLGNRSHTYGPYFDEETVGKLVRGL